jgi:hypothetical protein
VVSPLVTAPQLVALEGQAQVEVVAGSPIRVEVLPGPRVFGIAVAAVLVPLGLWLALTRPPAV